jgi:hypothetical protein
MAKLELRTGPSVKVTGDAAAAAEHESNSATNAVARPAKKKHVFAVSGLEDAKLITFLYPLSDERKEGIIRVVMKYTGKVRDGVVVLEGSPPLKDGTVVAVEPLEQTSRGSNLGQRLKRFSGSAKGLPQDMARNHDHYLHGRPKK